MLDIIIPAYNEELRIEPTLRSYLDYFSADDDVRITVVANACVDNTVAIVESVQQAHPTKLHLINIPDQVGKGGAIMAGWKVALENPRTTLLAFIDADGSTSPSEFAKVMKATTDREANNKAGAIASRFIQDARVIDRQSLLRTTMSKAFIWFTKRLFGMPYTDTQCGAKIVTREAYIAIMDTIHTTSMAFDVDMLWQAYQKGFVFCEVPTVWIDKPGSSTLDSRISFLKQGSKMVKQLLAIKRG